MDSQYYQEFLTLVETKNFWEASERLFIGESSLSKHISRMEMELGVKLFDRSSRRVELTKYGKLFIPFAEQIVRAQASYKEAIINAQEEEHGVVQLGMLPSASQYRITDLFVRFHDAFPESLIKVKEDDSLLLKKAVRDRQCELAFIRESRSEPIDDSDLVKIPFAHDYMVALFPRTDPMAEAPSVSMAQLQGEKFIMLNQQTSLYDICVNACLRAGFTPHVIFACHRLDTILDLVTQGMGISLLMNRHVMIPPHAGFDDHVSGFAVVPVEPRVESVIYLTYRKNAELSQTALNFIECMKEYLEEQEEQEQQ
ncbi:MAG: LysR family transcriptional regulator [Lachnospiraceae bacterium]|nr:LysR family transcriptional regulator [Lachnospiraceae bacterium]